MGAGREQRVPCRWEPSCGDNDSAADHDQRRPTDERGPTTVGVARRAVNGGEQTRVVDGGVSQVGEGGVQVVDVHRRPFRVSHR
jgi:hypothetical protein